MLVTISGAQGSGKSTILAELQKRGYEVVERKTSRSILTDWNMSLDEINNDPELSKKFQVEILDRKISDELDAVNSNNVMFTERSYMDLFVYTLINLGKFNEHDEWINWYYDQCIKAQRAYCKRVFYVKSGLFDVAADGVRGSNKHYSRLVDLVLEDYTVRSLYPEEVHIINVVDLNKRIEYIENNIKNVI